MLLYWLSLFPISMNPSMTTGSISPKSEAQSVVADTPWDGALVGPSFDAGPESVVVSVGSSAYLACRVRQLGDRKVRTILYSVLGYLHPRSTASGAQ